MLRKMVHICLAVVLIFSAQLLATAPKNMILFIGDGMGFEQVAAAGMYANGQAGTLGFEGLAYQGKVTTYSADAEVTDSAAAGTAMATGHKVNNGTVSMAIPGDGRELETLVEYFKKRGKSAGLVTTTYITHATPAVFAAHEQDRDNFTGIAQDFLTQSRPNVMLGGGEKGMSEKAAAKAGYVVVKNRKELFEIDAENIRMVSGQFGKGNMPYEVDGLGDLPHLSEMAEVALKILDNDADGFFLMVEGGKIDHAGHNNDLLRNVTETIEFARAIEVAMSWARDRTDTLIIVTADHECGGLKVEKNNGAGKLPTVSWSTDDHTAAKVPVYAWGANAQMAREIKDNTQIFSMATANDRLSASSAGSTIGATGSVLVVLILIVAISRYKRKTVESHKVA